MRRPEGPDALPPGIEYAAEGALYAGASRGRSLSEGRGEAEGGGFVGRAAGERIVGGRAARHHREHHQLVAVEFRQAAPEEDARGRRESLCIATEGEEAEIQLEDFSFP